jgi:hypothetical protein
MLLDRLAGRRVAEGEDVVLPFELIIRRSSGAPCGAGPAAVAGGVAGAAVAGRSPAAAVAEGAAG